MLKDAFCSYKVLLAILVINAFNKKKHAYRHKYSIQNNKMLYLQPFFINIIVSFSFINIFANC